MKTYVVVDVTGLVTFITAASTSEAGCKAREEGFKPFIIRQI